MIDLHCDTLMLCTLRQNYSLRRNSGAVSLEKMRAGGVLAQCFAIYIPTGDEATEEKLSLAPYEYYLEALKNYRWELENNRDLILPALCVEDIAANKAKGLMSSILTVEDAVLLEGDISRIRRLYNDGVRMMSLCWNYENELCFPNSPDDSLMKLGLKDFGFNCVEEMNSLGMAVDVSHLSKGGFWDVVQHSRKPFAASHSCAFSLCPHPRNLDDEQLRALADKGGIVGLNFFPAFLSAEKSGSTELIIRHMKHIYNTSGIDCLSLGSDFDGFDMACEIDGCDKLPLLRRAMETEFSPMEIEKICSLNALRFFRDCVN